MAKLGLFLMVVVANILDIIPEDTIEIAPISGKDLLAKLQAKIAPVSGDGTSAEGDDYAFSIRQPKRPSRPVGSSKKDSPAGWKMFNGRCYGHPEDKRLSWEAAEMHCQKWLSGAHLASVHSPEEQAFIVDNFPKNIWLGGTDISQEGTWDWTDGTPFDYSDWYPGEPNDHGINQDCLWERKEHKWDDNTCEQEQLFLCKK